jgi:hypothetical protein
MSRSAHIKTKLSERLSKLLSLISPLRWIGVAFQLVPTIDYHKVITEHDEINSSNIAGNVITWYYTPSGQKINLKYGNMYINTDGTVQDRVPNMMIRNKATDILINLFSDEVSKAAEIHRIQLHPVGGNLETTPPTDDGHQHFTLNQPLEIYEENWLYFRLYNGQAGDSYNLKFVYERIPIPMEWRD